MSTLTAEGLAATLNSYDGDDSWAYLERLGVLDAIDAANCGAHDADENSSSFALLDGSLVEFDETTSTWYVARDIRPDDAGTTRSST